jgi:hypothetical protein
MYLANERKKGRLIVVDLNTLKVTDSFKLPASHSLWYEPHYSDLCWFDGALYALMREDHVILKIDPITHLALAEYSFASDGERPRGGLSHGDSFCCGRDGRTGGGQKLFLALHRQQRPEPQEISRRHQAQPVPMPSPGRKLNGMIRNIIFDWSGTLVDDLPAVLAATNFVFQQCGVEALSLEKFRAEFCLPFKHFYDRFVPHVPLAELERSFHGHFPPRAGRGHPAAARPRVFALLPQARPAHVCAEHRPSGLFRPSGRGERF